MWVNIFSSPGPCICPGGLSTFIPLEDFWRPGDVSADVLCAFTVHSFRVRFEQGGLPKTSRRRSSSRLVFFYSKTCMAAAGAGTPNFSSIFF